MEVATQPIWWELVHRCPLCGEAFQPGTYAHGRYADHMILRHMVVGPPCDEDCAGCVTEVHP